MSSISVTDRENVPGTHEQCVRILASARHASINRISMSDFRNGVTVLHAVCENLCRSLPSGHDDINAHVDPDLVRFLLLVGSDRFARAARSGWTPMELATNIFERHDNHRTDATIARRTAAHAASKSIFASGIDYWQRKHHHGHSSIMKDVVRAVLLTNQRLLASAQATKLPHVPAEVWRVVLGFLRSADFVPSYKTQQRTLVTII